MPAVSLSSWLRAFQQTLTSDDSRSAPGSVLLPLTALEEVILMAGSPPPESPADRASLQDDVGAALEALGPHLQEVLSGALADYRANTLPRLPSLLATTEGLRVAAAASDALSGRLMSDPAAAAAWRDVRASFAEEADLEIGALHVAQLREIVEWRGHAWEAEADLLGRIINDSAWHCAQAGADIEAPDDFGNRYEVLAGFTEDERLDLIERYIARTPQAERFSVWLAYFDAVLAEDTLAIGSVLLVDARSVHQALAGEKPDLERLGLPAGREGQYLAARMLEGVDDQTQAVLARVEVTGGRGRAVDRAQRTVSAMLDVATFRMASRHGWHLSNGYVLVSPAGTWWSVPVRKGPGPAMNTMLERFVYRPERELERLDPALFSAWGDEREDAVAAVELARWHASVRALPDGRFRVALGVRNLERTLPRSRLGAEKSWTEIAAFYLKDVWRWAQIRLDLEDFRVQVVSPPQESDIEDHIDEIGPFYHKLEEICGSQTPPPAEVIDKVEQLIELMPEGSSRWRLLRRLQRETATPETCAGWLSRLGQDFDRMLARAARQRNAVIHGSHTSERVIANVQGFIEALNKEVIEAALEAATAREQLEARLERRRLTEAERTAAMQAGSALGDLVQD